ncbi:MAG: DUF4838 domain-containing protein [Abditibacteriota bacterium]|nr:DUF4838 domain-containing protein [Abditibacteriota bacterium]
MKTILSITLLILSLSLFAFDITFEGKPCAKVIISKNATAIDNYAKDEFIKYIEKITGATLPVTDKATDGNNIYIGEGEEIKSLIKELKPSFDWESLSPNGILIFCKDNNLILAGNNSGTIYAVYTFLEDYCGVKFLTPEDEYIPQNTSIITDAIDYSYKSPFIYRDTDFKFYNNNYQYDLKHKVNGYFNPVPKELGGHHVPLGFAHTLVNMYLKPEEYGKEHPDWYCMRNGERQVNHFAQLCLSNKEMVKELTDCVLKNIEANPDIEVFSLTQNDTSNYCTCPECVKLTEKYGHSGALLTVINQVADEVAKKYPNKYIDTFAYSYTKDAPTGGIKPRDNVIIRLCTIECDFGHPLYGKNNTQFLKNFTVWKDISKNLSVWDYVVNFDNYLFPYPNFQTLQPNLQFFEKNNIRHIFEEGDNADSIGFLNNYKQYIIAKLMWDPDLDLDKETKTFFDLYYGDASEDMLKVLDTIKRPFLQNEKIYLSTYMDACNYFSVKDWTDCFTHLNNALKKVDKDTVQYDRVLFDALGMYTAYRKCLRSVKVKLEKKGVIPFTLEEYKALLTEKAPKYGLVNYNERERFNPAILDREDFPKEGTKPQLCENLSDDDWVDIQENTFLQVHPLSGWSKIVDDPKASNGKTMYMDPVATDNYIQKSLHNLYIDDMIKTADVYMVYKVLPGMAKGVAFGGAIYNDAVALNDTFDISSEDTPDGEYITRKIGTIDMKKTNFRTHIILHGNGNKDLAECMYVDRFFLILHR